MRHRPRGMAVCRLCRGVFVMDGSGMGVTSTSLAIALSGSFADSFLWGRSLSFGRFVPSPAVVQQTDIFLPTEVRKGIGVPHLEVFQKRRRVPCLEVFQMRRPVPRPEGFLS